MEHTKGPWRVAPDPEFERLHPYHECRNIMAGDWVICRMTDHAEQRANARLIATAPEQNALLTRALALIERCSDYQAPNPESERPSWRTVGRMAEEWLEQTREILAAARGTA